ncbi:S-adenosyl-L-methionine-dependent methyltransferase [Thelephora ganbajun]|uniref:S-adenosyl-L-methionine-dependent methyltransferase n=1 Tax=Thelephora ganbajun TaxID=370292 RepID=A0ACB6Z231_THEGA|nr:S-adenosyl-L-methionine-dependent methyltransferase [Thelephora ganbajun]
MFSTVRVSRSSLKRVPRSGFIPTSVSSTRTVLVLYTALGSSPYSTSTPNPSSPSTSNSNETPLSALPPLPSQSEWRSIFNPPGASLGLRERISIRNPHTARSLAEGFTRWTKPLFEADEAKGKANLVKGAPKIIIEAFPGPGTLTRALLTLPRDSFDKLIVLEEQPRYLDYLKPLEEVDDRVKVFPYSGYSWDTYSMLDDQGWLDDVPRVPWDNGVHQNLQFISHIPHSITGEQLVNQFLRCIPDKTWPFKYSTLDLIMGEWVWQRSSASPTQSARCKLSVIAEASAELSLNLPIGRLLPYDDHFHPTVPKTASLVASGRPEVRKLGHPMVGVNLLPHEEQVIGDAMLEKWDYCLRRLFVLKGQTLKAAIGSLAPGAQSLLKPLTDPSLPPEERVDVKKQIRRLDIKDWALILRAFNNWPFAPEASKHHPLVIPTLLGMIRC